MNTIREGSQVLVDFSVKVMRKDISLGIFFLLFSVGQGCDAWQVVLLGQKR